MIKKTLILILIIFVILNKHFFYHITITNIRLLFWTLKNFKKKREYIKKLSKSSIQKVFLDEDLGITNNSFSPFFNNSYTFKFNKITDLMNPKDFGKTDSLPHIINYFTTPNNYLGQWVGDSIFRIDYELRGDNNALKEKYMSALTKERVDKYQIIIRNTIPKYFKLNTDLNLFDTCTEFCCHLLYELHLGIQPSKEELNDVNTFVNAVAYFVDGFSLQPAVLKQLYNLRFFYKKSLKQIRNIKKDCIIKDWLNAGMPLKDCFIEFIHNIVAMIINWVNTIYPYFLGISKNEIPRIERGLEKEYILECFRYIMPLKFIASNFKNQKKYGLEKNYDIAIHDLKTASRDKSWGNDTDKFNINRMKDFHKHMTGDISKCPFFNSKQKAKIACNTEIYERDNYTPFGIGYRRCPGEVLSMKFLEEVAFYVKDKQVSIHIPEGQSKIGNYVFDKIEMNYMLKLF